MKYDHAIAALDAAARMAADNAVIAKREGRDGDAQDGNARAQDCRDAIKALED